MNETNELLLYIYQNCKMGNDTLTTLINTINTKDNKIKKVLESEIKEFEKYIKDSEKLLKKNKVEIKEKGVMASIGSYMGIKMEMIKDNSDGRIADMLVKGMTMGIVDITKRLDSLGEEVDKEVRKLAEKLKEYEQSEIKVLKAYL